MDDPKATGGMIDHLEELRGRLIVTLISIGVLSGVCLFFSDGLIEVLSRPVQSQVESLYFFTPYEAFVTKLKVALVSGVILSAPVILTQMWRFISPGLYGHERGMAVPLVWLSSLLFFGGVLFAYFLVIPFALRFFLGFQTNQLVPLLSIGSYISFFLSLLLIFGLVFILPVVLVGLIAVGILPTAVLSRQRKIVIVVIFVSAAVLTPTMDIVTQCLLAVPMWLLFECSLVIGRRFEKRRASDAIQHGKERE